MESHQHQQTRLICAGLPRTGTTSLAAALEILGFGPVLHGVQIQDRQKYTQLLQAKTTHRGASASDLHQITGISLADLTAPYNSTLDLPTADFSAELCALYPGSLVILTVRDSDSAWWRSWDATWGAYHKDTVKSVLLRILIWPVWEVRESFRMDSAAVAGWRQRYGWIGESIHARHNAEVVGRIPGDRLLVYNVKQGWDPLCRFLGVQVPKVPFPHVNDLRQAMKMSRILKVQAVVHWAIIGLAVIGGIRVASVLRSIAGYDCSLKLNGGVC